MPTPLPLPMPPLPILRASWTMTDMARKTRRPGFVGSALRCLVAGYAAISLAGCGTLSGAEHSCESTLGLLDKKKVSCTGSVERVSGSPPLSVIEIGEDLDGAYWLEATIAVGRGTAKAHVTDVDDERVGGEVSPGEPLEIGAVVYPEPSAGADEDTEEVEVQLEVKEGEEIKDLRYEATLVERD
jgi:hypothetical protein